VFAVELAGRVRVARVEHGVLVDQAGVEWGLADRAGRFEAAGVEVLGTAWAGGDLPVCGAVVAAHDHRTGVDELADLGVGELLEQDRRTETVRRHVVVEVIQVDAQPDLRREVDHRVNAVERVGYCFGVSAITNDQARS